MRQKLAVILTIVGVVGILVAINSATYLGEEKPPDSELTPNRSSYHAGPTGTRALYDFLAESGYKVRPEPYLLPPSGKWTIRTEFPEFRSYDVDPANSEQMTEKVSPLRPVQPTFLTRDVESVLPSRFASPISFSSGDKVRTKSSENKEHELGFEEDEVETPSPSPSPPVKREASAIADAPDSGSPRSPAPLVHFGAAAGSLLIDYPHGQGQIILLSDPYIFANGGIGLRDNLQLAVDILAPTGGLIAFDEYHQGRGATHNAFVAYFAGTPVLAICGQLVLLILLVLWTQGRRFARPLPVVQADRRSRNCWSSGLAFFPGGPST